MCGGHPGEPDIVSDTCVSSWDIWPVVAILDGIEEKQGYNWVKMMARKGSENIIRGAQS